MGIRSLSLLLRRRHSLREGVGIRRTFDAWRDELRALPAPAPVQRTLLVVRLDDIGDYLLFRNQLGSYKHAPRWREHRITLLGNSSWKELFIAYDRDTVDDVIWVNKREYLESAAHRNGVWQVLRSRGFDTVIAPSRTRPLLLDDLCMLAAAPRRCIGSRNTYVHPSWNQVSDALYQELYEAPDAMIHEFRFNGEFSAWATGIRSEAQRPSLPVPARPLAVRRGDPAGGRAEAHGGLADGRGAAAGSPYLVCFIGANTRSRRWPAKRWIEFIARYRRRHAGRVVLAGNGAAEQALAQVIRRHTDADSLVGAVSLQELLEHVAGARAVVTNDTMAAHLGVSVNRPTLIVANGVNFTRFTDYAEAGIAGVATVYPDVFLRKRRRLGSFQHHYADALTADIASIGAEQVLAALEILLRATP